MAHKRDHILVLILMTISTFTFMIPTCHGGSHHPFAAKASLLRLWRRLLPNARLPPFLLEKASPLNATSVAVFGGYIANHTLSDHIASFCTAADLLCTRRNAVGGAVNAVTEDVDFQSYHGKDFKRYKVGGVSGTDSFKNYSDGDNVMKPEAYQPTPDLWTEYERYSGSAGSSDFSSYGPNTNVPDHHFKNYGTDSNPGMFFRENLLVQGSSLPLPNLKDYMPRRSFLPRSLADKLPSFSSQSLGELVRMFSIPENSSMEGMMAKTLKECERPAVKGEIKKCVTSIEGMAEFAVGILGAKVEVLTTASTAGSGERVKVGEVNVKDGGRVTRSVSCHQSMFPYLVYYCHSVPKVKVYEAALMRNSTSNTQKINDGVAICHLDTTEWSAGHAAFVALGHKPGQIEVCHWIFENDLIWVPLP